MAGLPAAVIERAKEVALALSDRPTVEAQAPLGKRLSAPSRHEETQLPLEF
jgi:DNA mismatch repair ATPase MutS